MTKYNITEKKEKAAAYRNAVSAKMMDSLKERIVDVLLKQKKYRDPDYSARQLSADLQTNPRYISAAINLRFDMNYSMLVNSYRVEDAKDILADHHHDDMRMEEVSQMVGFSNRQSFYAAFFRFTGTTPRDYKMQMKSRRYAAAKSLTGNTERTNIE